jgi:hypothetical protein
MIAYPFMDTALTQQLFGAHTGHVPLQLQHLHGARLLWLNRRAMHRDPQFSSLTTVGAYEQHLLDRCAYWIPDEGAGLASDASTTMAVADRYGGNGIGRNGGSGRAVFINGYHVKGVGRTPLISPLTDRAHASGGAYLEECAREAIFSEIVDEEFPHGSVPVLAIIDTGLVQIWETDTGPKPERRCLLVRPAFMRPAHFMRAVDYIGHAPREGMLDAQRVAQTAQQACARFGTSHFAAMWFTFWQHWAEQLAYAYVHRLNHGGNSESNIAQDGRLLDFGGMTALPSWARIILAQGGPPAGADMHCLAEAMSSAMPLLARHVDHTLAAPEAIQAMARQASTCYRNTAVRELLRILGLTTPQVTVLMGGALAAPLHAAANRLFAHFAREQFCIFDGIPQPRVPWDVVQIWDAVVPQHLRELRTFLENSILLGQLGHDDLASTRRTLHARCRMLTRTRTGLFRDHIKQDLYETLDGQCAGDTLTAAHVTNTIHGFVLKHRLDSGFEPEGAAPIGFARSHAAGYALFKDLSDGQLFALQEWHDASQSTRLTGRLPIAEIWDDRLVFKSPGLSTVAVCMQDTAEGAASWVAS